MPIVNLCNFCIATEPFFHMKRTVDFHVMIYVTEGAIYVTEDHVDYEVGPGQLLFLKHHFNHYGKKKIAKGTKWYFVHFHLDEPSHVPTFSVHPQDITEFDPSLYTTVLPKKLSHLQDGKLEKDIVAFTEYYHSDDPMKPWNLNHIFFQLLTQVSFYGKVADTKPTLSDQIGEYLYAHSQEPFSADLLQKHFFLSYKHMAAVFKKEKQMTMQQYHTLLRMNKACNLLKSTSTPIGKISSSLGFSDMLYFSRTFHNFTGVSPTEYRKMQLELY